MSETVDVRQEDLKRDELDRATAGAGEVAGAPYGEVLTPATQRPPVLRFVFIGPNGLRPGWGLLLFVLLTIALGGAINAVLHKVHHVPVKTAEQQKVEAAAGMTPKSMLIGEGSAFALIALTSWIMSRIERRPVARYGFGGTKKVARFLAGFVWGLVFLASLVGVLWKARLLVFDGRHLFGPEAWKYGAIWIVGFLFVGLMEEYLLRGYVQYTLARGFKSLYEMLFDTKHGEAVGFWAAAVALSFLFGLSHGSNPGESAIGLWSAGLIGLVFCFTLWRTGSLWWALGFHASWDWAQSYLFGVADSGMMVQGHLYATHPVGKVLWSGGATGPEGSVLVLPQMILIVLVIAFTLPRREWSIDGAGA